MLGSFEQMQKTGTRVLVSGSQVYTLPLEKPLQSWFSIAGEFQWTSAPKILGESGLSAAV